MPTGLMVWFQKFKNRTFTYKPDQMKIKTFSVHGPCIFSAFAISVFSVCPDSTAIFGHKSATQPF